MANCGGVIKFTDIQIVGERESEGIFIPFGANVLADFIPDNGERITLAPMTIIINNSIDPEVIYEAIRKIAEDRD